MADIMRSMQAALLLGHPLKVVDIHRTASSITTDAYLYSLLARAYIQLPSLQNEAQDDQSLVNTIKMFTGTSNNLFIEQLKRVIIICQNGEIEEIKEMEDIKLDGEWNMEIDLYKVSAYLKIQRSDLAENKVNQMKKLDDEHVCTLLADICVKMANNQNNKATDLIDELKERFFDSPKLVNMRAVCLMSSNVEQSYQLLSKLATKIRNNKSYQDNQELECCLSNLQIASRILGMEEHHFRDQEQEEQAIQLFDSINI